MRLVIALAIVLRAATATAASAEEDARRLYEEGLAKYNIADFDAAIEEFKQSYELSKAPRLLFNIAQAYRLKKDWEHALYFYNTYLRNDPRAPNRSDVESRIDEMKQKIDAEAHAPPNPTPQNPPPQNPQPQNPPSQNPVVSPPQTVEKPHRHLSPRRLKIIGGTTLGLGIAAAAIGGGLLGLAASDADKVRTVVSSGGIWDANAQHAYDEGTRSQTAAIALISVGGAAVIAGIVVTAAGVRAARR